MDTNDIIKQALRIRDENMELSNERYKEIGPYVQACEFIRNFAGAKSSFFARIEAIAGYGGEGRANYTAAIIDSFVKYIQAGLHKEISIKRQAQIDVVSDLLEQAHLLLEQKKIHPAAPIVLAGAVLEEFLRNWIEDQELTIGSKKPCIDSYCKVLRQGEIVTKQDVKDITSWAGIRNHAAHGEWDEVSDRSRAKLMLEGINLFMRKYGS